MLKARATLGATRALIAALFVSVLPVVQAAANVAATAVPPAQISSERLIQLAMTGDPVMQTRLADAWRTGAMGMVSDVEAERWYRRAALQGNAEAQNDLGAMLEQGRARTLVGESAQLWYQRAAMQDYAPAQFNLGTLLLSQGVGATDEKAAFWIAQAAEQGLGPALATLGVLFEEGRGVRANRQFAVQLYERAAIAGNPTGQFNLALALEKGDIVPRDLVRAQSLFRQAASQGHPGAAVRLAPPPEEAEQLLVHGSARVW